MASQATIAAAMAAAATRSSHPLDPRFITKRRNHYEIQELEVVKIDRTRINLYPSLGADATDAEKTHSFNIAKAAFTSKRRISTEDGLVATASRLNCHTQMSSAISEVVSDLDDTMFDPASMVVVNYLTKAVAVGITAPAFVR